MKFRDIMEIFKDSPDLYTIALETLTETELEEWTESLMEASGKGNVSADQQPITTNTDPKPNTNVSIAPIFSLGPQAKRDRKLPMFSQYALDAWSAHVALNSGSPSSPGCNTETLKLRWRKLPPREIGDFMLLNSVELLPSLGYHLGSRIAAIFYAGPTHNRILISHEVVTQPLEVMFLVYHMYMHRVLSQMPRGEYGWRLEYERSQTPKPVLETSEYGVEEGLADDGATCLWDDWYVDTCHISPFSRVLVKSAMSQDLAGRELIRTILRNRKGLWNTIWRGLGAVASLTRNTPFYNVLNSLSPSLQFKGTLAVVEGRDRHAYLISAAPFTDTDERTWEGWRRWIPSRRVLARLGLTTKDIAEISQEQLGRYKDGRLLIEPADVKAAYELLSQETAISPVPNVFASSAARLAGLNTPLERERQSHVCSADHCVPLARDDDPVVVVTT